MPRLTWDATGQRYYETGVDRGVLYVGEEPGVPWSGLISVNEKSSGGEPTHYYMDGEKFNTSMSREEFEATITAFTYPREFEVCDGTHQPRSGFYLTAQRRKPFGFSYRTMVGDENGTDSGYKIHIVYNAMATPSDRDHQSQNDQTEPGEFSWALTTRPPSISGYARTSHVIVDSRYADPLVLELVEDILYGTETETARLPSIAELISVFDTITSIVVTDNGDGTFTVTAPFDVIRRVNETTYEITSSTISFIDENTYTISSS